MRTSRPRLHWLMASGALIAIAPVAALARDSLGVFGVWAAFRDPDVPRCYAIATPRGGSEGNSFMSIATWPRAGVRAQIHIRLAAATAPGQPLVLAIGERRFRLRAQGQDAWATAARADRAIIAAIRSSRSAGVAGTRADGRRFALGWSLRGAATAIDAAALGCTQSR